MLTQGTLRAARYLDLLSMSQRVTASNIANADTPGYRTRALDFDSALDEAMQRPAKRPTFEPQVRELGGLAVKNDGNDVVLDSELRNLSETAIRFSHALLVMRGGIRQLRQAIQEGRGA
ncbi:MAG: flagellar biosynthesis protein FlgB [Bryobacterales bacterium]|nr:flagellar biosynthesis protein FlgB [Bryobacterales bacterium]